MDSKKISSGYAKYNPDAKRRTKINPLEEIYPELPENKYDIIYADPPWDYGGKMQYDKSSIKSENIDFEKDIFISIVMILLDVIMRLQNIGSEIRF